MRRYAIFTVTQSCRFHRFCPLLTLFPSHALYSSPNHDLCRRTLLAVTHYVPSHYVQCAVTLYFPIRSKYWPLHAVCRCMLFAVTRSLPLRDLHGFTILARYSHFSRDTLFTRCLDTIFAVERFSPFHTIDSYSLVLDTHYILAVTGSLPLYSICRSAIISVTPYLPVTHIFTVTGSSLLASTRSTLSHALRR